MRNFIIALLVGILCFSCIEEKEVDLSKEILEFVLKDRIKLNSSIQIIQETNDSIGIFNLTLIENSHSGIVLDTSKNTIWVFSYNSPPLSHQFFKNSISFIKKQQERLKSSDWDTTSMGINIEIDSPLKELGDSIKNRTKLWIARNVKDKAFLQISEPIYNTIGEVMVSAKITVEEYVIDKLYILTKENEVWQLSEQSTLVGKQSEPEIEEIIKPDGTVVIAKSTYMIVLGYYDI